MQQQKSPPLALPLPLPLRPFRTYGSALQKTTTETERRKKQLRTKNWKKENRRRYSYWTNHTIQIFFCKTKRTPKPRSLPPPPKFIKITKIAVKYLEEIVRWSSRRRSYGDVCNERERERRRETRECVVVVLLAAAATLEVQTTKLEITRKQTQPNQRSSPHAPFPPTPPKPTKKNKEKKTTPSTFPSPTHPRQTQTEKT